MKEIGFNKTNNNTRIKRIGEEIGRIKDKKKLMQFGLFGASLKFKLYVFDKLSDELNNIIGDKLKDSKFESKSGSDFQFHSVDNIVL